MNILVFGAGVLGSLYATRLHQTGYQVSVLAQGRRLAVLRKWGMILESSASGRRTFAKVRLAEQLGPEEEYDFVLVAVGRDQLPSVLPLLAANSRVRSFLFMVCDASGPESMIAALGRERVLMGYPGASGLLEGCAVRYFRVPALVQRTVLGELDGRLTPRLQTMAAAFRRSGFPVSLCRNIDAWLKTHAAWAAPVANAINASGGDNLSLAGRTEIVSCMVRAVEEGFSVLRELDTPLTGPFWVRAQRWLPAMIRAWFWRAVLRTRLAGTSMAEQARVAKQEMSLVTRDFLTLASRVGISTPAIKNLAARAELDAGVAARNGGGHRPSSSWRNTHV